MILELKGTKVSIIDKTLGYQGDNLVNTIQVTVDKDSIWEYKLDMYKGKSKCFDSVLMTREGDICTVQLTDEILSYGGRYVFQLRGYTNTQTYLNHGLMQVLNINAIVNRLIADATASYLQNFIRSRTMLPK